LPENETAWYLYQYLGNQISSPFDSGKKSVFILDYQSIEFVFSLYIPEYSPTEKQVIFEKILIIHKVQEDRNGR